MTQLNIIVSSTLAQASDFELEGSARSVVQFEAFLPEAAPCVVYVPIDLDGQVGIVVDIPHEVYDLVRCPSDPLPLR